MVVKAVPDGFHTVTPYLTIQGVPKLLDFLKRGLGAEVIQEMKAPDGSVMHAQARIGDSIIMMGEAGGQWPPMPSNLYLYVPDVDALYRRALAAGGTSIRELTDEFYGDRVGGVKDPVGNNWWIATRKEDLSPEDMARRAEAAMKHCSGT